MNYIALHQQFAPQGLFSTDEVRAAFPSFDARRLVEWQQKDYIQRVVNRWYLFRQTPLSESLLQWMANRIYQPSYLSLQTAFAFYNLIPEGVYSFTSVSTRKTQVIHTPLASFVYQHLKPTLYFGYQVLRPNSDGSQLDRPVLMATLEKALLDYCYLHPHLATIDDFAAMRLNATLLRERVDPARLNTYLTLFDHQKLSGRIGVLRQYINDYA